MTEPGRSDSSAKWEPKHPRKWSKVPVDLESGKISGGAVSPFDAADPESDWGAYDDGQGNLVVPCNDGIQSAWNDLFPPAPERTDRHFHGPAEECTGNAAETDVVVEVTERAFWYREYRCSFVVEASMTWRITKQKYICEPVGNIVAPNAPGIWKKNGNETVETVSKSRKTEFKCC